MPRWNPCKRKTFIRRLRALGFEGPHAGAKHQFMVLDNHRLAIPSNNEFSVPQLRMMLAEVAVILGRDVPLVEWQELG